MLEHLGIRWGYTFLRTSSRLPSEDVTYLMIQATEMYLLGEEERKVVTSSYKARLYTEKRYELLGQFGGQRFDADLDTIYGNDSLTFLVNEQTSSEGPAFSPN